PPPPPPNTDYERYYPKYVDSKESLTAIQFRDLQAVRKAERVIWLKWPISHETIPYGRLQIQKLDIYKLPGDAHDPVIFFIHAGNEDKETVTFAAHTWLSLGYTVVSINHRCAPENSFPEMVEDCNMALKWVMDHIQDHGGDPENLAVTGFSCGGHMAALLVTDTKSHEKYGIDISKVKCWFPMSGFYDMDLKENLISPVIKQYIEWICVPYKQAASPSAMTTGKEPPCLIVHGGDDWCVPKTNAVSLYNQLDKEKTTLAIIKGYMHANIFYCYLNSDHEPAKLIKNFLATHLPTKQNPKPEKGYKK
ncbi:MAG: alpha/beta hydrolase, partial [Desulfobacteraceae bacterium]|nr:alpha/beta hydrolase [Desulfobacteraceae bacterium]MBC2756723.1 alpha/beta hydrolase [Desulfobacteraceae bacterium]